MEFRITYIAPPLLDDFPIDFVQSQKQQITSDYKFKFRLRDGDRNVYFKGLATRNDSFDPLDFLGCEYGCTDLQFYENGKFTNL